ncbi:hypothetical protein [Actinoplanes aureus]|uniref:Uncharacterized protein n=1 Tax=Actinoplanes aureus TaxID=2792083 RepID=A0A931C2Z0_9ACTN|nr:hypothetical protein [Actinoplanes aureus]MBG0560151.1 hypothetical protein [Actinoplanes aureus]
MFIILGPALILAAGFFTKGDGPDATGATLVSIGLGCWLIGLIGVYQQLRPRAPRYVAVALPMTVFGVIGGVAFSVQALHEVIFGISHERAIELLNAYLLPANVLYWLCGPLFPISLMLLGALLLKLRATPVPVALLIVLGGLLFPLSRITREEFLIHAADLVLLLPFLYLGLRTLRPAPDKPAPVPAG